MMEIHPIIIASLSQDNWETSRESETAVRSITKASLSLTAVLKGNTLNFPHSWTYSSSTITMRKTQALVEELSSYLLFYSHANNQKSIPELSLATEIKRMYFPSLCCTWTGEEEEKTQVKIHSSIKLVLCTEWCDYAVDVTCIFCHFSPSRLCVCVCLSLSGHFPFTYCEQFTLYPPHKVLQTIMSLWMLLWARLCVCAHVGGGRGGGVGGERLVLLFSVIIEMCS